VSQTVAVTSGHGSAVTACIRDRRLQQPSDCRTQVTLAPTYNTIRVQIERRLSPLKLKWMCLLYITIDDNDNNNE